MNNKFRYKETDNITIGITKIWPSQSLKNKADVQLFIFFPFCLDRSASVASPPIGPGRYFRPTNERFYANPKLWPNNKLSCY